MLRTAVKKTIRVLLTPFILGDYFAYMKKARGSATGQRFELKLSGFYPQIKDKTVGTRFDRHYVYHTAWAARVMAETRPAKHVDISSSLFFSALVSAFVPVDFYDYRPAALDLSDLASKKGDLHALPFADGSVPSLSCMHTIEHVGLGRYGEPMDPEGDIKAVKELKRVAARGGNILFVVPMGEKAKIEFNAHRIYTYEQVVALFDGCALKEFAFIPEHESKGGLMRNVPPDAVASLVAGESYACGCFLFSKK